MKTADWRNWGLFVRFESAHTKYPAIFTNLDKSLAHLMPLWIERSESRRQLGKLDERLLKDAGITRLDAEKECHKPFWQA